MSETRNDIQIVTFGCRLNAYESEVMRAQAQSAGLDNAVIVNTCAVTAEAERQARQAIRRARRDNPEAEIIVTGCAAQIAPGDFAGMPEVDRVLGNEEKLRAASFATGAPVQVNDIMSVTETAGHLIAGFGEKSRAFVQVQTGCDHRCTFCIIPFGRGNARSVPLGEIVRNVRELVADGYAEVVLTGVDITSWGKDLPGAPKLGQLARRLLAQVPELPRLRISSIDSIEVDDDLLHLIADEPRLMPHLHLSLQAGDDMILKRMKRRHLRDDAIRFCQQARRLRPDMVFGADLIAGFPTETDEMFENTLALVEECDLTWLHVFPYSERAGTPAARMPQVDKGLRKARAARLRALGERQAARFMEQRRGTVADVLVERGGIAHSEHFAPVRLDTPLAPGSLVTARLGHVVNGALTGTPLGQAAP